MSPLQVSGLSVGGSQGRDQVGGLTAGLAVPAAVRTIRAACSHDAAEAALLPLVQPPGAPTVDRTIEGLVADESEDQLPILPGTWAEAMVPNLYQLWTSWDYGDGRPHGPVALTGLKVLRPGPDEFLWLDLTAVLADPGGPAGGV